MFARTFTCSSWLSGQYESSSLRSNMDFTIKTPSALAILLDQRRRGSRPSDACCGVTESSFQLKRAAACRPSKASTKSNRRRSLTSVHKGLIYASSLPYTVEHFCLAFKELFFNVKFMYKAAVCFLLLL